VGQCACRCLLAYCLFIHWHLVLWPQRDGDRCLLRRLTTTHAPLASPGAVSGAATSVGPVQVVSVADAHLLTVCRYVERNPLRARLVPRAEDWRWSSLSDRVGAPERPALSPWPVARPADWLAWVNEPQTAAELAAVRTCVRRGRPYGGTAWSRAAAERLGLPSTLRRRGRPRKEEEMT
jgi:putative transposase